MRIRVVVPSAGAHVASLASHVNSLQKDGKRVLLVTVNRPYRTLCDRFEQVGIDTKALFFVDAVSCINGAEPMERPPNTMFLQSPTMLEMIAMRTEQILTRMGEDAHVVVDCLNAFALYNGVSPVQEFSHYLANRLRSRGVDGDLLVLNNDEGRALESSVSGFTDGRLEVSP